MNTIKELFNGTIRPFEAIGCTKEIITTNKQLDKLLEKADEIIPRDNKKYFSDMVRDEVSDLQNYAAEQAFELGFALGVRLTAECYMKP